MEYADVAMCSRMDAMQTQEQKHSEVVGDCLLMLIQMSRLTMEEPDAEGNAPPEELIELTGALWLVCPGQLNTCSWYDRNRDIDCQATMQLRSLCVTGHSHSLSVISIRNKLGSC